MAFEIIVTQFLESIASIKAADENNFNNFGGEI